MAYFSLFGIIFLQCCTTLVTYRCNAQNLSKVPAMLIFGDSSVDTGNNNYIPTLLQSNYAPYGLNFPGHIPTGRFSDGKLIPDLFASALGLKETIPPFLQPNLPDSELLTGVCFASAGAGLDDLTITKLAGAIPILKQPEYLAAYIEKLKRIVGEQEAQRIVRQALVVISAGCVDFINNYYLARSLRTLQYSVSEYQDLLLNNLQNLLKKLYSLGCRKMSVVGLPPLGCVPAIMIANSPLSKTCIEKFNSEAQSYNEKLVKLLSQVQANLPGSKILYADSYTPLMDMIKNPKNYGFVETARGCCGTGLIELGQLCNPLTPVCEKPSQYIFWDAIHPSEAAFRHINSYLLKDLATKI